MKLQIQDPDSPIQFDKEIDDGMTIHLSGFEGAEDVEFVIHEEDVGIVIYSKHKNEQVLISPQDDGMVLFHVLREGGERNKWKRNLRARRRRSRLSKEGP